MTVKKVSNIVASKGYRKAFKKGIKKMNNASNNNSKISKQLEQDKFELENHKKRLDSEIENLEYSVRKIQFFPEDLEKAKGMSREERNDFMRILRKEHRYTYVDENPNQ